MKTEKKILMGLKLAGAVMVLAGCGNEAPVAADIGGSSPDAGAPLVFTSGEVTRGTITLNNENIKDRHFRVSAYYTGRESFFEVAKEKKQKYFLDVPFFDNAEGKWQGSPSVYWPLDSDAKLSFFAYAPDGCGNQVVVNDLEDNGWPSITVTPMTNVTNQPDFCVAAPLIDKTRNENLPLNFDHMLTKIIFAARYEGEMPSENYGLRIDQISIKNVVGTNILRFSNADGNIPVYDWDVISDSSPKVDYSLTYGVDNQLINSLDKEYELPKVTDDTQTYKEIQFVNGNLYLIPQELPDDAELEVTYCLYELHNENNVQNDSRVRTTVRKQLTGSWPKGHAVTYNFTLFVGASKKIVFEEPKIEEWKTGKENEEIIIK